MPVYYGLKRRESLTFKGEVYKKQVKDYLEVIGFSLIYDSFIEGTPADMIMVNPIILQNGEFHIECKSGTLSLHDPNFIREFFQYFLTWKRYKDSRLIRVYFFFKDVESSQLLDSLFGTKFSPIKFNEWLLSSIEKLPPELKENLQKTTQEQEYISFMREIEIFVYDIEELKAATEEKRNRSNLSLEQYAKIRLKESERLSQPIDEEISLTTNMLEIIPPPYLYIAKSKKPKDTIYEVFNNQEIEIPPFNYYPLENQISTFHNISKDEPFYQIINGEVNKIEFNRSTLNTQFMVTLINLHLRRILWKKGLRRQTDTNIYFFELNENEDGDFNTRIMLGPHGSKEVSIPYYNREKLPSEDLNIPPKNREVQTILDSEGSQVNLILPEEENGVEIEPRFLRWILHHGAEISVRYIFGKFYLIIEPIKVFTRDGRTPLEGVAKDKIDRKFREPLFNRNSNNLSLLRFWSFYILSQNNFILDKEDWFGLFKIKEPLKFELRGCPQPSDLLQNKAGEFF